MIKYQPSQQRRAVLSLGVLFVLTLDCFETVGQEAEPLVRVKRSVTERDKFIFKWTNLYNKELKSRWIMTQALTFTLLFVALFANIYLLHSICVCVCVLVHFHTRLSSPNRSLYSPRTADTLFPPCFTCSSGESLSISRLKDLNFSADPDSAQGSFPR